MQQMSEVIVIGAGIAGALTADDLSKKGFKVILLEAGDSILPENCTSQNQVCWLHTGIHFSRDHETAKKMVENTVAFKRHLPSHIFSTSDESNRGRAFIFEGTIEEEALKATAAAVNQRYKELVKKDPNNEVLLPSSDSEDSEDLIKLYTVEEFKLKHGENNHVLLENVAYVMESFEPKVDMDALKEWLEAEFKQRENIEVFTNSRVKDVVKRFGNFRGYQVTTEGGKSYEADVVVNACWTNSEHIFKNLGIEVVPQIPDNECTIVRIKFSIEVELPESLLKQNSFIMAYGAYCSFTNLGNGKARIIYEPVNDWSRPLTENSATVVDAAFGHQTLKNESGQKLAKEILAGACQFCPELEGAKITALHRGEVIHEVKTEEKFSIFKSAAHDSRLPTGCECVYDKKGLIPGLIKNQARKMTYATSNAAQALQIVEEFFDMKREYQSKTSTAQTNKNFPLTTFDAPSCSHNIKHKKSPTLERESLLSPSFGR